MAWQQRPRTKSQCLPAGEYDAELAKVERKVSKAGNTMDELAIRVIYGDRRVVVKDWIVLDAPRSMAKVGQLAKSLGREDSHRAGRFSMSQHVGGVIRVALTLEEDPKYGWQNRIDSYMANGHGLGPDVPPEPTQAYRHYENPATCRLNRART